jgi:hypothetical protein
VNGWRPCPKKHFAPSGTTLTMPNTTAYSFGDVVLVPFPIHRSNRFEEATGRRRQRGCVSERLLRLALKTQGNCRATAEAFASMQNPPAVFARQAAASFRRSQAKPWPRRA